MRLTSLLVVLIGIGTGCTVGLVDETKPIEAMDTAADTENTDTDDTEDTEDSGPDIDENSENPWNGEWCQHKRPCHPLVVFELSLSAGRLPQDHLNPIGSPCSGL